MTPTGLLTPNGVNTSAFGANSPSIATPAVPAVPGVSQVTPLQGPQPAPAAPAPVAPPSANNGSIVDFLNSQGQASDINSRSVLANKYGISNYTGTAAQNTQLLGILRSISTGNVNSVGIPNDIGKTLNVPPVASPNAPIDLSTLPSTGNPDVDKVLAAGVKAGTTDSDIAGLLALYGASTPDDSNYDALTTKLTDYMNQLGGESADLQSELDKNGVGADYDQVKQLNLQAAQQKGELDKFDAETVAGQAAISNKTETVGSISTETAKYNQQRDLTRIAKAADLSATLALSQAYQGNAELGTQLAQQSVDLKYKPIENQIEVLKEQVSIASDKASKSDAARFKVIDALINQKTDALAAEKDNQKQIQSVAIEAASNGAPLSVVNSIKAASDPVEATQRAGQYVKGTETSSTTDNGVKFAQADIQKLAAAGLSSSDIASLQSDINAHGVDAASQGLSPAQQTVLTNILSGSGGTQFLSTDFFKQRYGTGLDKAAKDAGFTKGGILGIGSSADSDAFLNNLMSTVNQYRSAGYTDKEILQLLS